MKSHLQSRPDQCVNYTVAQDLVLSAAFCVRIYCHLLKILNLCTKSLIFFPAGPQQLCRESWPYISFFRKRMAHFPCLLNLQTYQRSGSFTAWPHMLPQTCKTMAQLNRPLFFHFLIHLANLLKHDPSHTRMHSIHMPTSPIVSSTVPANLSSGTRLGSDNSIVVLPSPAKPSEVCSPSHSDWTAWAILSKSR